MEENYEGLMMSISHWGCFPYEDWIIDATVDWVMAGNHARYDLSFHGDEKTPLTVGEMNVLPDGY